MPLALILLIVGTALVFFFLIGYPILLAVFPFRTKQPVSKDLSFKTTVTAIVAVYNGAAFVRAKLDTILALDYPRELLQIIVVSDGSTDATDSLVREYADRGVQLISAPHRGKAAAINLAIEHATGETLFFTDVRQPLDPMALRHLVANFADPSVGAVTGEMRLLRPEDGEQADMDLYWRYEVWARKQHSRIDSVFNATGCIYAIRRKLAAPIPPDSLTDDAVLPMRGFFQGYRVILDPEAIAFDYPALAGTEFRRRFRTLAGMWQVFAGFPQLFSSRNRMRFHFLSHKFARLMLPWSILLIVGATIALPPSNLKRWLLDGEIAMAALALLDFVLPRGFLLKRYTSMARTFITMNAASASAIVVLFTKAEKLWTPTRVK
jgi:cellulose synthase/poly-beta-1,6-N-acetylglucosamine synthase-like glycosyltransferase